MTRRALLAVLALVVAGCSSRPGVREADWERGAIDSKTAPREETVQLPPYPQDGDLLEFFSGPSGSHRFFIDAKSLSVSADSVRYTLVIRTAGGALDVSYEGMRCRPAQKRVYATGQVGRKWLPAKNADWEPIRGGGANPHHTVLYQNYLCPDRVLVKDANTVQRRLRETRYGYSPRQTTDE